jgi:hypothetical protein
MFLVGMMAGMAWASNSSMSIREDSCSLSKGQDCQGNDLSNSPIASAAACCDLCANTSGCHAFTYDLYSPQGVKQTTCYMKTACPSLTPNGNTVSGTNVAPSTPTPPPAPTPASFYKLAANYQGETFFDNFDFFTASDPTVSMQCRFTPAGNAVSPLPCSAGLLLCRTMQHGFVNFVDKQTALSHKLVSASATGGVYMAADNSSKADSNGRMSVRLTEKRSWDKGLVVLNITHMPAGCGTWPAFWMVGPSWPNSGEIDILEGVNTQTAVQSTLHTNEGCVMPVDSPMTGHWGKGTNGQPGTNCWVNAPNQYGNAGCGVVGNADTYGAPFNDAGGGVFATDITATSVRMFFFPMAQVPADLAAGRPDPDGWGTPYAYFTLGQDCPASHFKDLNIVFDLTFCGDWAGGVFANQCPGKGTCQEFVQNSPSEFSEAYWQLDSVKVFSKQ